MAGIGFELKRILAKDTYTSVIGAYSYAGIITSGPWLIAILTILILSVAAKHYGMSMEETTNFQVIIVYMIAGSLIISSLFQHSYTRFIADQFYLKREKFAVPSLNSIYCLILFVAGMVGLIFIYYLLPHQPQAIKILILAGFCILCMIWVTTSVLSGLLAYKGIFTAFITNFFIAILMGWLLKGYGLSGLLVSFLCGQFVLLMILVYIIYKYYPTDRLINYAFFHKRNLKIPLFFTGFFYNLGIWIDKFIFWYSPQTGINIIGRLNESIVYDTPIFLAYLAVIPGTVIFLLHMETDYADAYFDLYNRVNGNNTFLEIEAAYWELLLAGRRALYSAIKSQAYVLIAGITIGAAVFTYFGISIAYVPLFCICLLAASLNVIFWAALDLIFYLDKIYHALILTFLFLLSNTLLTWVSIQLGIFYYGFGLVLSLLIVVIVCFVMLNREIKNLLYETYVFSPGNI